jgi:hypothetical protein
MELSTDLYTEQRSSLFFAHPERGRFGDHARANIHRSLHSVGRATSPSGPDIRNPIPNTKRRLVAPVRGFFDRWNRSRVSPSISNSSRPTGPFGDIRAFARAKDSRLATQIGRLDATCRSAKTFEKPSRPFDSSILLPLEPSPDRPTPRTGSYSADRFRWVREAPSADRIPRSTDIEHSVVIPVTGRFGAGNSTPRRSDSLHDPIQGSKRRIQVPTAATGLKG